MIAHRLLEPLFLVGLLLRIVIHKIQLSLDPLQIRVIKTKRFVKLYSLSNDTSRHREYQLTNCTFGALDILINNGYRFEITNSQT